MKVQGLGVQGSQRGQPRNVSPCFVYLGFGQDPQTRINPANKRISKRCRLWV